MLTRGNQGHIDVWVRVIFLQGSSDKQRRPVSRDDEEKDVRSLRSWEEGQEEAVASAQEAERVEVEGRARRASRQGRTNTGRLAAGDASLAGSARRHRRFANVRPSDHSRLPCVKPAWD